MKDSVKSKLLEAQISEIVAREVEAGLADAAAKTEARVSTIETEAKKKCEDLECRLKLSEEEVQALKTRLGSTESDMGAFVSRLGGMDERVVKLQEDMQKTLNGLRTQVNSRLEEESAASKDAAQKLEALLATAEEKRSSAANELDAKLGLKVTEMEKKTNDHIHGLKTQFDDDLKRVKADCENSLETKTNGLNTKVEVLEASIKEVTEAGKSATTESLNALEHIVKSVESAVEQAIKTAEDNKVSIAGLQEQQKVAAKNSETVTSLTSGLETLVDKSNQATERLTRIESGNASLQERLDALSQAEAIFKSEVDSLQSKLAEAQRGNTVEVEKLSAEVQAVLTKVAAIEAKSKANDANQAKGTTAKREVVDELSEKVKALEGRQGKITKHIVDLSSKVASSAQDARTHEDSLRRHITDTVSPLWETMNMLSRRIDSIM